MPYIFLLFKYLKNKVLKKDKNQPFPGAVWGKINMAIQI